GMPRASKVWLSTEQQDDFERFARSRTLAARLVQRAQIVLQGRFARALRGDWQAEAPAPASVDCVGP
ncbi:MAG: hypothetical protein ABSA12_17590, partial [Verrucomicrobiia bacterium]